MTGSAHARPHPLSRVAVVATVLSVLLTVALVTEARTAPQPSAVPGAVQLSPAAAGSCAPLRVPGGPRVLFVGDSMTQGRSGSATYRYWAWRGMTDPVAEGGAGRDDVRFVGPQRELNGAAGRLDYEHRDRGFDDQLAHAGRAGATYASLREQFPPQQLVRRQRPDVVVLQLGFNDSNASRTTPNQLAARFANYMKAMWAVDRDIRFVLGQIPQAEVRPARRAVTTARNQRTKRTNELVGAQWRDSPCRVQVNRLRTGGGSLPRWSPAAHTYDGAHPNAAGETLMAQRMLDAMTALGVLEVGVSVFDPAEPWEPQPRITARADGSSVRVDWPGEIDRISATLLRLRIGSDDEYRLTPWLRSDTTTVRLEPGEHEIRAVVNRGLPGRMVSSPGAARTVQVR